MNRLLLTTIVFVLMTGAAFAETLDVGRGLVLEISIQDGWALYLEPPAALVEHTAEHIAHEAEAQGADPTQEQLRQAARKRLAANEAILYHEIGGAHLDIDFSPLNPGEKPPNTKTLRNSAKYAVQSLEGEEGVSDVDWDISPMKVRGAKDAFLLAANYMQHQQLVHFLGVIGFAGDQWFFLYYTDRSKAPGTLREMQEMLDSAIIRPAKN